MRDRSAARVLVALLAITSASCSNDTPAPGDGTAGCVPAWQCTTWTTAGGNDMGMRTCTDMAMCGTNDGKPVEAAMLPALNAPYYECNVEPIVIRDCSQLGCHGVETGRGYRLYARGRLRITGQTLTEPGCSNPGMMFPSESCIGGIECRCWSLPQFAEERRRSFDSARGFALDGAGMVLADKAQSELLRQPLTGGGFAHAGIAIWGSTDADYTTVKNWLEGATLASCNSMN